MPPDKVKGAPRATEPGSRPAEITATATAKRQDASTRIVSQGGKKRRAARRAAITARVSLLVPDGQRTWWHYLVRCPISGRPHLGRSRELADVTGTRRLPCQHWIVVVVARTYGRTDTGAAA